VKVCGNVTVDNLASLTILPGVYVEFQEYFGMQVNGTLLAVGTKKDTIVFTAKDTSNWESWMENAGWDGISISAFPNNDSSKLVYCRFELSNRYLAGGVVSVTNAPKVYISDCLFYHNESVDGSALSLDNAPIYIRNCTFYKNQIPIYGSGGAGAVNMISSNAIMDQCVFIDNHGYRGALKVAMGAPKITNCIFRNNSGRDFAGAIYMYTKTNPLIYNNIFENNDGGDKGGAMYITGNPTVSNNFISNNTAGMGGGIYGYHLTEGSVYTNNLIVNNYASSGGGMYIYNDAHDKILLSNNTIVNNHVNSKGGGIYCQFIFLEIYNTIIWGNEDASGFNQVNFRERTDDSLYIRYSNIQGGLDSMGEDMPSLYENNLDSMPLFMNPTPDAGPGYPSVMGDWDQYALSPSINSGIPDASGLPLGDIDLVGNDRINFGRIDMGAIENQSGVPSITQQPAGQVKCETDSVEFAIQVNDSVYYQWTLDNIDIPGADEAVLRINSIELSHQGSYQCKIRNSYGTVYSNPALLQVKEKPFILQEPESAWAQEGADLSFETFAQGSDLKYQWQKDGLDIPNEKIPKLTITDPVIADEGKYKCVISNMCSSIETDSVDLYMAPQICMVTVSETSGDNLIVWEKGSTAPIMYYNIYRISTSAGIYDKLATVPYDDLSVLLDSVADPTVQAYLYKITAIDTAENETDIDLCNPHKTIHLLVSTNPELQTTQLEWDNYYGFEYTSYVIYRSSTGTTFSEAHSLSSDFKSWTETEILSGDLYYRISVERPDPCYPSSSGKAGAGPYHHALSNLDNNKLQAGQAPPDTLILSNSSIYEENNPGAYVGRFITEDLDTLDAHDYHLIPGEGDDDNFSFTVAGDLLLAAEEFDYETKINYSIRVRTTDLAGNYYENIFSIQILDVNEATGLPAYSEGAVKVFPNPFSYTTTISFPNSRGESYRMRITDLTGKVVLTRQQITSSKIILNAAELEKGYYLIELSGTKTFRGKIIVD